MTVRLLVLPLLATAVVAACQAAPATRPAPTHDTGSAQAAPAEARTNTAAVAPSGGAPLPAGTTIVLPPVDPHGGGIPPEMIEALRRMTSEDFKVRENAVNELEAAMTRQFRQMVQVQDLLLRVQQGLAEQLAQMTQTPDTEAKNRVAGLMEFNSAVSKWAVDVMALPASERDPFLKWGITDEHLPIIARAYNRKAEVRAKAAREIAKLSGPEPDWLLVQLLNDNDREVSLTAIDAVGDRPPTPAIMDCLWDRAVGVAMAQFRQRAQRQRNITIRGRTIVIYEQDPNLNGTRQQDVDVVVDILIGFKSDDVTNRLNAMFKEMTSTMTSGNDYRWRVISPNYGEGGRALSRLVDAYKPREAVPFLMKVVGMENTDGYDTTVNNNEKVRYSTAIDGAALFIKAIGQDPDDYGLKKYQNFGDRWLIKGGQPEENELKKKLQAWWKVHQKEYTESTAATVKPTGAPPATGPAGGAAAPAGAAAGNKPMVLPAQVRPLEVLRPAPRATTQPRSTDAVVPE
jgi:hypothetical protein